MDPQFLNRKSFRIFIIGAVFLVSFFSAGTLHAQCPPLNVFTTNSPYNCMTSSTTATASVFGGAAPYTYTWLPAGGNASVAIGLTPNSYTVLVTDQNGCTGSGNLIILSNSAVSVFVSAISPSCTNPNSGTVIASISGGSPPYNYSWSSGGPNSATLTNVPAGFYQVTVTDQGGCTYSGSATVMPANSVSASISASSITCNGGLSSATVSATGASGSYTYNWSPVAGTGSVISNIPANNYSCTISDGSGCSLTATINITQPPPIQNTITTINVSCNTFTNGQASSNVSGGTPAYSFTWSPINVNASSVSGLGAGNYTLTIKDAKGCKLVQPFAITEPPPITYTATHTDEFCINADGSATVNVNGGNGGYTYSWTTSPVQTASVAVNLAAGTYSIFITDSKGCKNSGPVTIGNITNVTGKIISQINVSCSGLCNGGATAGVTGGSGPYSYDWLGITGGTLATVSGLCAGTYSVKVSDVSGCYTYTAVTITEPAPLSYSVGGTGAICFGKPAVLTSSVSGGSSPYSYSWTPGNLSGSSVTVSPSTTTAYSLVVTDSKGCTGAPKIYSVNVSAPINLNAGANSLTVCPNVGTSITANASGGDGNYSYLWLPGNITTNTIAVNLASTTTYTVKISDGCGTTPVSTVVTVNVLAVQNPSFSLTNQTGCEPLCVQFNNTSSGTTTATWNFGDFTPPVTAPVVTHCFTKSGVFNVALTITNSFGCKATVVKNGCVTVNPKPNADFVQHPERIDLNDNVGIFENASTSASNFNWYLDGVKIGNKNPLEYQFLETGCYDLKLIASNQAMCSDTIEKEICVTEGFNFWMPNAFSPDGDTKNDILIPQGTGWMPDDYTFEIFDRWGELIFKTDDPTMAWDGKVRGSKGTDEIYVWHVFLKDIYDKEHEFRGHVLIMR
jgi:gliding motility-associated-like protein